MRGSRSPHERVGRRRRTTPQSPAKKAEKRVAIYTRKSVEKGLEQEFNSLDAQRARIEGYVTARANQGWVILNTTYDDGGFSGGTTDRPAFQRLMTDVRAGLVDVVAVYKFDRLSRSVADFTRLMAEFQEKGVDFISVTQDLDGTTPIGRVMVTMLASLAQFEREMISERTSDKICATRRKGLWTGGHAPYGFTVIEKKLLPDPEMAERVPQIFQTYLDLGSVAAVAAELNRRCWKTVKGRLWSKTSVHNLLRNPTYIGRIPLHGEDFDGQHDAIVDPEVFERVQVLLDSQGPSRKVESRNKWEMLLRGTLFCAECAAEMVHHYTKKKSQLYHYYRCPKNDIPGKGRCTGGTASAPAIEDFIIERVKRVCQDRAIVEAALRRAKEAAVQEIPAIRQELAALGRERAQVALQREKLLFFLAEDAADPEATRAKVTALREDASALEARDRELGEELSVLKDAPAKAKELQKAIEEFLPLWDQLTIRERIRVLGLLIERIEFDCRTGETEIFYRDLGQDQIREAS